MHTRFPFCDRCDRWNQTGPMYLTSPIPLGIIDSQLLKQCIKDLWFTYTVSIITNKSCTKALHYN